MTMFFKGLGPRKFRNKEVNVGDRSVWTETPSQRENKQKVCVSQMIKLEKTLKHEAAGKVLDM